MTTTKIVLFWVFIWIDDLFELNLPHEPPYQTNKKNLKKKNDTNWMYKRTIFSRLDMVLIGKYSIRTEYVEDTIATECIWT